MNSVPFDFENMPRVEWFGVTILEPATVITNLMITAACLYGFHKLKHLSQPNHVQKVVKYFFLVMALSTAVGGVIGHGFLYITGIYGKLPGWYISMFAVAIMERSAIVHARPLLSPFWGHFFSKLNYIEIATFIILSYLTLNFSFIELHATYGLFIVVFTMELYTYIKMKDPGFKYLVWATAMGIVAAVIHLLKIDINRWFNYNDLSHIAMIFGVLFYYKAFEKVKVYETNSRRFFPNPFFSPKPASN